MFVLDFNMTGCVGFFELDHVVVGVRVWQLVQHGVWVTSS
jgi:hypothetical protein